jgi:carboxylate-amine ligase
VGVVSRFPSSYAATAHAAPESYLGTRALEGHLRARFDRVASFTVGAEEELLLLDADTLAPAPAAEAALRLAGGDTRLKGELRASQVEAVTPVCVSVADVARELASVRRLLGLNLARENVLVAGAGTHPLAPAPGPLSRTPRYRRLAADHPWAAAHVLTCGLHVHVAVGGADRALAVHDALRSYVPELIALGANAPYYRGEDSGLATVRPKLNEAWPRGGVPPAFGSWRALAEHVAWGRDGGAFADTSELWWDVRLNAEHGTIEVRAADTQTRAADAAAIVAFVQSLVRDLAARYDAGEELRVHPTERIAENAWLAMRDGLTGHLIDLDTGVRVPTSERLRGLAEHVRPTAAALGCEAELRLVEPLLLAGGGAARQVGLARRVGLAALPAALAAESAGLASGFDGRRPSLDLVDAIA